MSLLEKLQKKVTSEMEEKHYPTFERQARYLGNGVYSIPMTNLVSTCTRELFLMFVACREGIPFKNE
jgi:hypothetical protein